MGRYSKLKAVVLAGTADANVDFAALCQLLEANRAKPYQVRQVRGMLVKYELGESDVD